MAVRESVACSAWQALCECFVESDFLSACSVMGARIEAYMYVPLISM